MQNCRNLSYDSFALINLMEMHEILNAKLKQEKQSVNHKPFLTCTEFLLNDMFLMPPFSRLYAWYQLSFTTFYCSF